MRSKARRQRRRPAFWLLLAIVVGLWVWRWPARQPIADTIDHLKDLGYRCLAQDQTESVYLCTDANGGNPTSPLTKTTLWLYSPYETGETEVLMDNYCQDSSTQALIEAQLRPVAWEFDRQAIVLPHQLYGIEPVRDQYLSRKAWLADNLGRIPTFSLEIDLDTRCIWYTTEPSGGSLF